MPFLPGNLGGDQTVTSRMVALTSATADVATSETTTSTSFTDLATPGPAATLSSGVTQVHLILYGGYNRNGTGGQNVWISVGIAGAAAQNADTTQVDSPTGAQGAQATGIKLATAQATGATHTLKYLVPSSGTGTWVRRRIIAVAL